MMFSGKALHSVILEAEELNVPFNWLLVPSNLPRGESGRIGLIHFSFSPKKAVISITKEESVRALILKPFKTGSWKALRNAGAIGSFSSTAASVATLCIYTLMVSWLNRRSKGEVAICPATKSWVLEVSATLFISR